jgi:hypothetical protein
MSNLVDAVAATRAAREGDGSVPEPDAPWFET